MSGVFNSHKGCEIVDANTNPFDEVVEKILYIPNEAAKKVAAVANYFFDTMKTLPVHSSSSILMGAFVGAVLGTLGGPVGIAVGAVVGAVVAKIILVAILYLSGARFRNSDTENLKIDQQ